MAAFMGSRFDRRGCLWQCARLSGMVDANPRLTEKLVVKAEWGTKRACPKCNTRFYDLTKDEPATCIACGYAWVPEPILKSKQTTPFEQAKPANEADGVTGDVAADEDLDLDAADEAEAPDVDLGDDDDLGTVVGTGEDEEG
jgi:uncharacterized protein (TIGR02300 family)